MDLELPDYGKIVNELFANTKYYEIGDKIEAYYQISPIKGITFYFNVIVALSKHWASRSVAHKPFAKIIKQHCNKRIKEIKDEKRLLPKIVRSNLLSGMIGTVLGAIIGLMGQYLQKPQELKVSNFPKISVVHDTVYIVARKDIKDTSLVRLVKRPTHNSANNTTTKTTFTK